MKRRVYVAVVLPRPLQEEIREFQRKHQLPVRWIAGKNLHITLLPPRHTADIEEVKSRLRSIAKHKRFSLTLNKVAYGPNKSRPRVIWATGPNVKGILDLQEHAESTFGAHHDRQFRLHVTLARFNPEHFRPTTPIDEHVEWSFIVDAVVLVESHLSSSGADYEIIEKVEFEE